MSQADQALWFDAVPLLLVSAAYLGATGLLAPPLWAERRRASRFDIGLFLVFPTAAALTGTFGVVLAFRSESVGGWVWPTFAATLAAGLPALLVLWRWRERTLVATGSLRVREAEAVTSLRGRELESMAAISSALGQTHDASVIARELLSRVEPLVAVDFAALVLVDWDARGASGLLARTDGGELEWFSEVRIDLEKEASGVATAVFEAAPFSVYDAHGSATVSRRLVEATGVQSIAFVPLVADARVIAVLVVGTTTGRRAFAPEELTLLQTIAGEAALALDRSRSTSALAEAVQRERFVARIAARVRSELDTGKLLRVAVEETGRTLGVDRCFIGLLDGAEPLEIAAQWHVEQLEPLEHGGRLAVSNLAARRRETVAVDDVELAQELDDETLGGRAELIAHHSRAALAAPIVVFDELIGVLALHRSTAGRWSPEDVAMAEAVAREIGLGLRVARLLAENERRIEQQSGLLAAAQSLTSDLELPAVLERLVRQVADLLKVEAADCYLYDDARQVLRCEAVHGLPGELVGFEFPADRGAAAAALQEGRPVIVEDYGRLPTPAPGDAYDDFASAIVAPMRWSGAMQGVLGVGTRKERAFGQDDADLVEAYAGLASLALANAQAFDARSRQARVQRGFFRIAAALGQSLSRPATLDALAQAANEALDGAFVAVLMPRGESFELTGATGLPSVLEQALAGGLPRGAACLRVAASEGRILASRDVAADDRFETDWVDLAARAGYSALLAVPVASPRAEARGLVLVFFDSTRVFVDEDLELARHLGDAARGALERSELFEAERTARALSQQLARTGGILAGELDPTAVLDEVVQQAPKLLSADACAIRTLEEDELVVVAAFGDGAEETIGTRASATARLSGDVFQARAPVAVEDATRDDRLLRADPIVAAGHVAFLGVPLSGPEGALSGVLAVYARRPRSWWPEEIEALLALAANTSAALANAELYSRVSLEKERSVAILANIADGIVAVDRDGKVVLWNAAAEQITGVPAEEALGRSTVQILQRTLESGTDETPPGQRLVSILRGDQEVWLSLSEAVMRDPLGSVAGRIMAFRDISADRMVEQVKSDFVAAVSHELRTPLTSIYGFAETLRRRDVHFGEEEQRTFLGYIAAESERLTGIVDQLLNVARLDAGDLTVELGRIDLGSVVSEVVETVEETGPVNGHRFRIDLPEEPLAAEADPDKVRQIFNILVENALKYSPAGATVTVGARRNADRVEVRVADEGNGIPQAEQERIFRKFYRAESTARGGGGGTGLGLFIAKELVTAMGGRIWVDSAEGKGSSFAFELPAARE